MGRQPKEINWDVVERQIEAGCSAKEIYGNLCDSDTFYKRFKERYGCGFRDYSANGYEAGNGNIRFTQYLRALAGNTNLLILLGKERLGQGKDVGADPPRDDILSISHENMILKAEIDRLKAKYGNECETESELLTGKQSI